MPAFLPPAGFAAIITLIDARTISSLIYSEQGGSGGAMCSGHNNDFPSARKSNRVLGWEGKVLGLAGLEQMDPGLCIPEC